MSKVSLQDRFVAEALSHTGYRAGPNRESFPGASAGVPNQPWGGAFITYVIRSLDLDIHPFTSISAGLSYYTRQNRLYRNPHPGDILVCAYSSLGPFSDPDAGIVTDISEWKTLGRFRAVQGETASGLPRASDTPNGVFEKTFYAPDVLTFIRPIFRVNPSTKLNADKPPAHVRANRLVPGKKNRDIETIQQALAITSHLAGAERGVWDKPTRAAYAAWARECGKTGREATASASPTEDTLGALGARTGLFAVKE